MDRPKNYCGSANFPRVPNEFGLAAQLERLRAEVSLKHSEQASFRADIDHNVVFAANPEEIVHAVDADVTDST